MRKIALLHPVALAGVLAGMAGCAGLTAKKVPLAHRLEGRDDERGFRYYTSRPYLVIAQRIDVGCEIVPGVIGIRHGDAPTKGECSGCVIMALEASFTSKARIYDLHGNPKMTEDAVPQDVNPADYEPLPALPASPAAQGSLGQGPAQVAAYMQAPDFGVPDYRRLQSPDYYRSSVNAILATSPTGSTPAPADATTPKAPSAVQVAWLPDFEEQIAIRHKALAAQDKFALRFRDGWQLDSVQASVDNTQVAVKAFQVLATAFNEAAAYEQARYQQIAKSTGASGAAATSPTAGRSPGGFIHVAIVRHQYVEPGMYRLTKESERAQCPPQDCAGLLADLGLPTSTDVRVVTISDTTMAMTGSASGDGAAAQPPTGPKNGTVPPAGGVNQSPPPKPMPRRTTFVPPDLGSSGVAQISDRVSTEVPSSANNLPDSAPSLVESPSSANGPSWGGQASGRAN